MNLEENVFENVAESVKNKIYQSLQSDDLSQVVMIFYEEMKDVKPYCRRFHEKNELNSNTYRQKGNDSFKSQRYKQALMFYNMALSFAPKKSLAFKLAYSNRSALLFTVKDYEGALKDIKTCYSLGCPDDVMKKLKVREQKCRESMWMADVKTTAKKLFPLQLLELDERSEDIPCASKAVGLDRSGPRATPFAVRAVAAGTVVARETAFVSASTDEDIYLLCHYCMKSPLNPIPCDKCCVAMFCDDNCKNKCFDEYHAVECKLMNYDRIADCILGMALKAVIKMKNNCSGWDEFIETSRVINRERRVDDHKKLFNDKYPFSLLHNNTDVRISYGTKLNHAFNVAILLRLLKERTTYFPLQKTESHLAMRATAAVLMRLALYMKPVTMKQTAENVIDDAIWDLYTTVGYFNFIGSLKHSCDPNLLIVPINNQAALVALHSISAGTPFTVSYVGHYYQFAHRDRSYKLYKVVNTVCYCRVCSENWGVKLHNNHKLTAAQKSYIKDNNYNIENCMSVILTNVFNGPAVSYYKKIYKSLDMFSDVPNTKEHLQVINFFGNCLQLLAVYATGNKYILSDHCC